MAKFNKKKSDEVPPISTASLPDIIFMLLFFFMTVTQTKDGEIKVANDIPSANQVQKLDKETLLYMYMQENLCKDIKISLEKMQNFRLMMCL